MTMNRNKVYRPAHGAVLRVLSLFIAMLGLAACSDADYEYASERCSFYFNNQVYQDITLQSALNPLSPGVFCNIYESSEGGRRFINFANNQGASSRKEPAGEDARRTYVLGVYNKSGIIVGYGNLSSPSTLYIYDSQCPNCYAETQTMSHRLAMDTRGIATCPTCKRQYDLNNRGISASGKPLMRYRGSATGPLGVLIVNN